MNLYLSFDHTSVEGSTTFYYFRAGLFHGNLFDDLLLLVADLDQVDLLSMPSKIPSTLSQGTLTQHFDGSSYEVPEDLYLLMIQDISLASIGHGTLDFLLDALSSQPLCVYVETPVTESSPCPAGFDPDADKIPNVPGKPHWYIPDIDTKLLGVASKYTNFPFWTLTSFDHWFAFGSLPGDYECEVPTPHITCYPMQLDVYVPPTEQNPSGYWRVEGYARNIHSSLESEGWRAMPVTYESEGNSHSLWVEVFAPVEDDDPIVWYRPDLLGIEPYTGPGIGPLLSLAVPVLAALGAGKSISGWRFARLPKISIINQYGFASDSDPFAAGDKALVVKL